MCEVTLVTCKLHLYTLFTCLETTLHGYTPCETRTGGFEVRDDIALTVTVCIALFEVISELQ